MYSLKALKFKEKQLAPTAPLCLRNVSKDFSVDNMKKDKWYRYAYDFSALRKKCPYSELFWSVFSCFWTRTAPNTDTFHADVIESKILHIQEYLHFYYLYLKDMANHILQKQTGQKEKKHIFLFSLWMQHPRFHLLFPENQ